MSQISLIDFTDEDFDMLSQALTEFAKPSGRIENMLFTGIGLSLVKDPIEKEQMKAKFAEEEKEAIRKHKETAENTILLRSKLIQLQRLMREVKAKPCPPIKDAEGKEAEVPL